MGSLPSGNYQVDVTGGLPTNLTQTYDLNGPLDDSALRALGIGEVATDVDFGYAGAASIGDTVWYDVDGDGTQNNDEPGIAGVTVTLLFGGNDGDLATTSDNVTFTTTTDASGNYRLVGLPVGSINGTDPNYEITTSGVPAIYTAETFDLDGTGTPDLAQFQLLPTQNRTDVDFGYGGTAALGDLVFEDLNGG